MKSQPCAELAAERLRTLQYCYGGFSLRYAVVVYQIVRLCLCCRGPSYSGHISLRYGNVPFFPDIVKVCGSTSNHPINVQEGQRYHLIHGSIGPP